MRFVRIYLWLCVWPRIAHAYSMLFVSTGSNCDYCHCCASMVHVCMKSERCYVSSIVKCEGSLLHLRNRIILTVSSHKFCPIARLRLRFSEMVSKYVILYRWYNMRGKGIVIIECYNCDIKLITLSKWINI